MSNSMEEKHYCRCCLSKECYKDMDNVYYIGNKTENYFEMLMDVFNINISNKDSERCLICEECVSKIREAAAFKKQVLNIHEIIKSKLCWDESGIDIDTIDPKTENENNDFVDFDDELSDCFTDKDFMWGRYDHSSKQREQVFVIELESKEAKKVKNNTPHNLRTCTRSNKSKASLDKSTKKTSPIGTLTDKNVKRNNIQTLKFIRRTLISSKKIKNTQKDVSTKNHDNIYCENSNNSTQDPSDFDTSNESSTKKDSKGDSNDQESSNWVVPIITQAKRIEKTKLAKAMKNKEKVKSSKLKLPTVSQEHLHSKHTRENTLKLIINSNLCLFRSFQNKFGCNFCQTKFPVFSQLREHTASHSVNATSINFKLGKMRGLSCKNAEISDLKCNLCSEGCIDLTELTTHLKNKHEVSFHGTEHYLVPYKLQDGFRCVSCDLKFNSYLRLSIHMNTHYANNVCEMCGQSFINRLGLRAHVHSMHTEKKCSLCPAVFLTNSAKVKHLRQAHNIKNTKRYCNLCNKTFLYTYMLDQHKVLEHGVKRQVSKCGECGKSFLAESNLKIHLRSVHVRERNYPCTICGMRFFTKCDQKRHERTHEDVRSFSCSYCDSKFKSKDSWRRHLKRQHGHVFGETSYMSTT